MSNIKDTKYSVKNLRFVQFIGPKTEFLGYGFVLKKANTSTCQNVLNGKEYLWVDKLDINQNGIVVSGAFHEKFNEFSLRVDRGLISRSSIISFILEKGTDENGQLHFYDCDKGALIKEYGAYWT